jgi:hypothetical protein
MYLLPNSWFGFLATAVVVVVSCVMSFLFFGSESYDVQKKEYGFDHSFFNGSKFSNAFNVFTFAFGATAIVRTLTLII